MNGNQPGFTLIELSVVLVIIGLIVGGVLVGRDMIEAASLRSQIRQFESYDVAINTFRLKYNCLPGDCKNANQLGLGISGNGNDLLENSSSVNSTTPDAGYNNEFPQFFVQLGNAGLINTKYDGTFTLNTGYPAMKINPAVGMIAAGAWHLSNPGTKPSHLVNNYGFPQGWWLHALICNLSGAIPQTANDNCGIFNPMQARSIDAKIDDGKPLSGKVWNYSSSLIHSSRDCLNNAYTDYDLNHSNNSCQLSWRMK